MEALVRVEWPSSPFRQTHSRPARPEIGDCHLDVHVPPTLGHELKGRNRRPGPWRLMCNKCRKSLRTESG
eukprot:7809865-Alexandrium_andersonii.AAC.1